MKVLAVGNSNTFGNGATIGKKPAKGNGKSDKPNLGKVHCFYSKIGHIAETCFTKHGFPLQEKAGLNS